MLRIIERHKQHQEEGFTLIELLVVILIIGILSAIAIPSFMNQRKSAVDASVKADLASNAIALATESVKLNGNDYNMRMTTPNEVELWYTDNYGVDHSFKTVQLSASKGNVFEVKGTVGSYCLHGFNDSGDEQKFVYANRAGGLMDTALDCDTNGSVLAGSSWT